MFYQDNTASKLKAVPNHFKEMYNNCALSAAETYLHHEEETVIELLDKTPSIKNLVVIGSGPAAYRQIADDYGCQYIGIDPYYPLNRENDPNIIFFDCPFESIKRNQLPDGPCLFLFWFNVLHYLAGVPGQNKKPHITGILSAIEINKS
jgi:hypothetical protein